VDLIGLEKNLSYSFKNQNFLKEALTHRSYLNENPAWGADFTSPHNERLEFLGDAVLELIVTENLFSKFPDYPEGQLTSIRAALVNYQTMAASANIIELGKFILLSKGEGKDTGRARQVILANAIEAVIGAIYLDGGYEEAKKLINRIVIEPNLENITQNGLYKDPKSHLQEIVQEKFKITPSYKILDEWGPDHRKIFRTGVYFNEQLISEGEGYSKQESEVEAAKNALEEMKELA